MYQCLKLKNQNQLWKLVEILFKMLFEEYRPDHIFNTDQNGFHYLELSSHTLATIGQKTVVASVSSVSATTHSYTIQPTISLNGQLTGPLYICLQELDGKFGPNVKISVDSHLQTCRNIVVTCSKSGKLQKGAQKCLSIFDSWTGQKDDLLFESMTSTKKCNRLQIPPKATQYIQPLDIYGFRQWKIFVRKITDIIELYNINVDINNPLNIITMHSLIHDQLSFTKISKDVAIFMV